MIKNNLHLLIITGLFMQVSAKNLDGPTYVCKDNTWGYTYRAQSCYSNGQYAWTCTNCEIWDDVNQQWVTSLSSSEGSEYEVIRFSNSTGYYATISVYAYGPTCMFCICDWTKYVAIYGPPAEANISGFDKLMNCDDYHNVYTLSLSNNWELDDWTTSSGLTVLDDEANPAEVKPSNGSVTGLRTLYANIIWRDPNFGLCPSYTSYVPKSINVVQPSVYVTGAVQVCPGNPYWYEARLEGATTPVPGADYQWIDWPSGWTPWSGTTNWKIQLYVPQYNPQGGAVRVEVDLECGTYYGGLTVYPYCYGGDSYIITPNPSSSQIEVEIKTTSDDDNLYLDKDNLVKLIFRNKDGTIVMTRELTKYKEFIDVSSLKPGTYLLDILINDSKIGETTRFIRK